MKNTAAKIIPFLPVRKCFVYFPVLLRGLNRCKWPQINQYAIFQQSFCYKTRVATGCFFGALLYIRAFNGFISMHFAKSEIFLG